MNNFSKKCVPGNEQYLSYPPKWRCTVCHGFWSVNDPTPTCHPVEIQGEERCDCHNHERQVCDICQKVEPSPLPKERGDWTERFDERFCRKNGKGNPEDKWVFPKIARPFIVKSFIAEEIAKAVEEAYEKGYDAGRDSVNGDRKWGKW